MSADHTQNCPCANCRHERELEEYRRNPYYRPPERSQADIERDLFDPPRCQHGPNGPPRPYGYGR